MAHTHVIESSNRRKGKRSSAANAQASIKESKRRFALEQEIKAQQAAAETAEVKT